MSDGMTASNAEFIQYVRNLRCAVIQQQYDAGNLSKDEAIELLKGPLTPGDETTVYDDSGRLVVHD